MATEITVVDCFPSVTFTQCMYMLEAMTYKLTIRMNPSVVCEPKKIIAEVWCNQYDKDNPAGQWHAVRLPFMASLDSITHVYAASVILTSASDFEYTFRMKLQDKDEWIWSHGFNQNGHVHVEAPRQGDKWTQGPSVDQITDTISIGNFIAASNAKANGFTHVLNCTDSLDLVFAGGGIEYKKVPLQDGAAHKISKEHVREAVDWLKMHDRKGNRILINCRAGIGRSGSIAIAFIFATHRKMTYEDAYNFVFQKRFIYPHSELRETLYELYPRDGPKKP